MAFGGNTTSKRVVQLSIVGKGIDTEGKRLNTALKSLEKQADKTRGTFGRVGPALATIKKFALPVAGVVAGAGTALVALGKNFQDAERAIAVATGASGPALEGLNDDLKAIYATAEKPINLSSVAELVGTLNTLTGASGPALQKLGKGIVDVAGLLEESSAAIAENFGQAAKQFNIDAETMSNELDNLYRLTQQYGVGLDQTLTQIGNYGSVLKNAGLDFAETAEFMAELEAQGISVSRVMPGINKALRDLAKAGVTDLRGELSTMIEDVRNAETATDALRIATENFGAEGAQRLTTAIQNGALAFDEYGAAAENSRGAIEASLESTRTLGDAWDQLLRSLSVTFEPLAVILVDALTVTIDAINDFVPVVAKLGGEAYDSVKRFIDGLQDLWTTVTKMGDQIVESFTGMFDGIQESLDGGIDYIAEKWDFLADYLVGNSVVPDMVDDILVEFDRLGEGTGKKTDSLTATMGEGFAQIGDSIQRDLTGGITDTIFAFGQAKASFGDFAKSFLQQIAQMITQQIIFNSLSAASGGGFGSFFGGFAQGAAFQGGNVVPFARGGVVTRPTLFPMAQGAGLMGEAGPEAVMPLKRDKQGRLGVTASGGPTININNYTGAEVTVTRNDNEIIEIAVEQAVRTTEARYARSMRDGYGPYAKGLEGGYRTRRRLG